MNVRELTTGAQGPITRSPFVGTRPFFRTDAPFFFGREREAARLANIVSACTMAVLYGESGVGKSSLLNARLPLSLEEIEPGWSVITFFDWQPGFEARFLGLVNDEIGVAAGNAFARPLLQYAQETKAPLLLVLDQFEEYFLYNPTGNDLFEAELARLVNRRPSAVRVLFSLRSDGLFLLDRLRLRIPDVFGRMMLIEPLNAEAAADCIIRPIEAFNAATQLHTVTVPDRKSELVNALVYGAEEREIRRRLPNPGRAELEFDRTRRSHIIAPFLQMALEAIWEEDVIKKQRSELTLDTLCTLANTNTKVQDPLQAVGQVA
jgi:Novel STAND NTPase 1